MITLIILLTVLSVLVTFYFVGYIKCDDEIIMNVLAVATISITGYWIYTQYVQTELLNQQTKYLEAIAEPILKQKALAEEVKIRYNAPLKKEEN